jgi:quercetin dioxygenase-like cupin family protein
MGGLTLQQAYKRSLLQRSDVPASNYEAVMALTELPANGYIPRETHPGTETGYVIEGSATLFVVGRPPLELGAGQSWKLAPCARHEFRAGPDGVKVLASWVVEKDKTFASPAS